MWSLWQNYEPEGGEIDDWHSQKMSQTCRQSYLTIVFNNSLQLGIFPDIFKISRVTPVDKGGNDLNPSNYRPISTLSALTQIFEKLIWEQLVNYLERCSIFYQYQFGFRKGHSTAQAIAEIADNLRKSIDNNLYTCGVFLDFSKAFDTVNHSILLKKIEQYRKRGIPLQLFTSYLTNRQQYTVLGNTVSSRQAVTCGIPQGSSLGPVLFLIYINDLPNCSSLLTFRIFADDTNVFASARDLKTWNNWLTLNWRTLKFGAMLISYQLIFLKLISWLSNLPGREIWQ